MTQKYRANFVIYSALNFYITYIFSLCKVVFVFVFSILFLFVFCSQALYYNPLFLILGYKFYYVRNSKNIKIFIISKREIKGCDNITFDKLKRINDYTFVDREDD